MSIALDVRTLMFAVVVTVPLLAAAQFYLWRQIRTEALLWWAFGGLVASVGTLSLMLRGQLPVFFGIVLGNTVIVAAMSALWAGIRSFQGRPIPWRAIATVLALVALVLVLLYVLRVGTTTRMIAMSLFLAAVSGICAFELLLHGGTVARASSRFAGFIFGANAVFFLGRAIAVLLIDPRAASTLELVQVATYLEVLVASIGWNYGFLMMTSQQAEERLDRLASLDELTGTYNRRAFLDSARRELARAHRGGPVFSVMVMDIDQFKRVNDTYGHPAGDRVLREFVRVAQECLRSADWLGRIGGEEFCVLLPNTRTHGAAAVAERLRQEFAAVTVEHDAKAIQATVSIGVAEYAPDEENIDEVIARADAALYRAKDHGRNRVMVDLPGPSSRVPGLRLVWDGAYSSGNALIDADHEMLVNRVNALLGRLHSPEDLGSLATDLRQILHWLVEHFGREEQILRPLDWPGFAEHAAQHAALAERGADLLTRIERGDEALAELLDFLVRDVIGIPFTSPSTTPDSSLRWLRTVAPDEAAE